MSSKSSPEKAEPIELLVFAIPDSDRVMNYSPFCAKSESLLRLCKIPYRCAEFKGNPGALPKGKLPVIKHRGQTIADSFFIAEYVKTLPGFALDQGLSDLQHADGFAYAKMCEEFLYWAMLYERWAIDSNWVIVRDLYFSSIPRAIRGPITSWIRKSALKSAHAHGLGRHSTEEIFLLAEQTLRAIDARLRSAPFIAGDKPSSYDATVYAFLVNALDCGDVNPRIQQIAARAPAIVSYCGRVHAAFGPRSRA